MNIARVMALEAAVALDAKDAYANLALNKVLEKHKAKKLDRAFATELFYGTIRRQNTLDWVLGKYLKQPLEAQTVFVRNILRQGLYQIMYMDRVPVSAACNESTELARKYGHKGAVKFVNGVLRNIARRIKELQFPSLKTLPVDHIAIKYSHPPWIVKGCIRQLGTEDTIRFCQVNNSPPPNIVRTNTLKINRSGLLKQLETEGVSGENTRYAPEGLEIKGFYSVGSIMAHREGLFYVQDESSILAGHAVSPARDSFVLDVCGGPGGKTTHLAQLLQNSGKLISVDLYEHKLKLIMESCRRLGINNVETILGDARGLPKQYGNCADYVLVDAPCSGSGVLRRKPDIRWRKIEGQIPALQRLQKEILSAAAACVRPGGVLVYSTCSVTREENEDVVDSFLRENDDFSSDSLRSIASFQDFKDSDLESGRLRLWPHLHNTDGFFIARMRKRHG